MRKNPVAVPSSEFRRRSSASAVPAIDRARNYLFISESPPLALPPFFLLHEKEEGRWRVNVAVCRRSGHKTQQIATRELF